MMSDITALPCPRCGSTNLYLRSMESPPVILAAGTSQALCSTVSEMSNLNSVLTKEELRADKPDRTTFLSHPRRPIRVILDNVVGNYNIGAVFRLCDALLIERLIISGPEFTIRKRRITQAAQGAQNWVLWEHIVSVEQAVSDAREAGFQIVAVELTSTSIAPASYIPRFPVCVVIGNERSGVSPSVVAVADVTLAIPMRGMSNSLNLATAAAIILYEIDKHIIEAAHV